MAQSFNKGDIVCSKDEYYYICKVQKSNLAVRPIWNVNSSRNAVWKNRLEYQEGVRHVSSGELRLMYMSKNGTKGSTKGRGLCVVAKSLLPSAKLGCIAKEYTPRGSSVNASWYETYETRHVNSECAHFSFYTKNLPMHKGRVAPKWVTIYPYQICTGGFANDGTKIVYKDEVYNIPDSLSLVNATHVFSPQHKLSVETVQDVKTGDEIFIRYGNRFWKKYEPKPIRPPMFVFGNVRKEELPEQFHKLYDFCYDTSEVVEDTESEEEVLETPAGSPPPSPPHEPHPDTEPKIAEETTPAPVKESETVSEDAPEPKPTRNVETLQPNKKQKLVMTAPMSVPNNDLKEVVTEAPSYVRKGRIAFPRKKGTRGKSSSSSSAGNTSSSQMDDSFMFESSSSSPPSSSDSEN